MKKILFFAFSLLLYVTSFGQGQEVSEDSIQINEVDSLDVGTHQISSGLENVTKAEGCVSPYIK